MSSIYIILILRENYFSLKDFFKFYFYKYFMKLKMLYIIHNKYHIIDKIVIIIKYKIITQCFHYFDGKFYIIENNIKIIKFFIKKQFLNIRL